MKKRIIVLGHDPTLGRRLARTLSKSCLSDVICSACGAVNSIRWEKKSIGIDDKQGSYKDLTFDFCDECGNVTNVDLS